MSTPWIVVTVTLVYIAMGFSAWCLLRVGSDGDAS